MHVTFFHDKLKFLTLIAKGGDSGNLDEEGPKKPRMSIPLATNAPSR